MVSRDSVHSQLAPRQTHRIGHHRAKVEFMEARKESRGQCREEGMKDQTQSSKLPRHT